MLVLVFQKRTFFLKQLNVKVDTILVERSQLAVDCHHKNVLIMKVGWKTWERVCAKKKQSGACDLKSQPFESRFRLGVLLFSLETRGSPVSLRIQLE